MIGEIAPDGRAVEAGLAINEGLVAINGGAGIKRLAGSGKYYSFPSRRRNWQCLRAGRCGLETDVIPKYDEQTGAGMIGIRRHPQVQWSSLRLGINSTVWLIRSMVASMPA